MTPSFSLPPSIIVLLNVIGFSGTCKGELFNSNFQVFILNMVHSKTCKALHFTEQLNLSPDIV